MDLKEEVKRLLLEYKDSKQKGLELQEANTKSWFIKPFLEALGYKGKMCYVEYIPDPNDKKPDKVDYALLKSEKPIIFVEAKPLDENLEKHHSQLKKYYNVNGDVEFAILTNGNEYQFYADINNKNQLDEEPFIKFCLEEIDDEIIQLLLRFSVEKYNSDELKKLAFKIKHLSTLEKQLKDPDDEFVRAISRYIFGSQKKLSLDVTGEIILMLGSKLSKTPPATIIETPKPPLPITPSPPIHNALNFFEIGDLAGKKIDSYSWEGQLKKCKFWRDVLVEIFKMLYSQDKEKFIRLNKKMRHKLSNDDSIFRRPKHISDNFFIDTNSDTNSKRSDLKLLLEHFEKKDSLYITLRN